MKLIKNNRFTAILAFLAALAVFFMSGPFQSMAYWGDSLIWYWLGVGFTYFLWSIGVIFLIITIINRMKSNLGLWIFQGVIFTLLSLGFIWTTFVVIMGMG